MKQAMSIMVLLAAWAAQVGAQDTRPAAVPAKLAPYVKLADQCAQYDRAVSTASWRVLYAEDFSGRGKPTWRSPSVEGHRQTVPLPPGEPADPLLHVTRDQGRSVLYFQAPSEQGLLAVGPKIKGDFAVEIVAKAISDRPCDLSLVFDDVDVGPAFQFGAHYNTKNKLWIGPERKANANEEPRALERFVELPGEVLIQKNTWHRVRLEVRGGEAIASVDGKLLGKAKLAAGYNPSAPRQPMVYCYSSAIVLREARIEAMAPGERKVDPQAAWAKAFTDTPRDQVNKGIQFVVDCLADDEEQVRDAAQDLLRQMGGLAVEPLERAAREGLPEQQARAGELLRVLRPAATTQPTHPPRAVPTPIEPLPPDAQEQLRQQQLGEKL